jgi:hypothetical protein
MAMTSNAERRSRIRADLQSQLQIRRTFREPGTTLERMYWRNPNGWMRSE